MKRFLIGGVLIISALVFLILFTIQGAAQYSYTVDELFEKQAELAGGTMTLRVTGFVIGESIQHDPKNVTLSFDVVGSHDALAAPQRILHVVADGHARPDLLKHEAQATITGKLDQDGFFYVARSGDSLLLNCPTRYEEAAATLTPAAAPSP